MAPKQTAAPTTIYAVAISTLEDLSASNIVSCYAKKEDADEAATQGMVVVPVTLHYGVANDNVTVTSKAKTKAPKSGNEAGDNNEAKKKSKKASVPEGRAGSLQGYTLMFSGTFDRMDRNTCEATATKFGAAVSKKIDDVDYVILGTKPGQKKLDEISQKGVKTMKEQEFLDHIGAEFDEPPAKKAKK
ncbi:hypothetical protein Q7P37_010733 [Cladosporium fusiforme]